MERVTQPEFNALAIFVAVAEELRREPFFSEDNHETLCAVEGSEPVAFFCHPAFLKSAVLPFRKLWLNSEPCAFNSIRDFVFKVYPDQSFANRYKVFFYDLYERELSEPVCGHTNLSVKDVIEIWLYTHAVHAGPKNAASKKGSKKADRKLQEFDHWARTLGREQFEYQFRSHLHITGSRFAEFEKLLAGPLYHKLRYEIGMEPEFEAEAALTYNPYPDPRFKITFDDPFWHLNKESLEETFDRLLARQLFQSLGRLFEAFFPTRPSAVAALCEFATLEAFFVGIGASFLKEGETTNALFRCNGGGGPTPGSVGFEAWDGPIIRIDSENLRRLTEYYSALRSQLFEERKRQSKRPRWAFRTRWDSSF